MTMERKERLAEIRKRLSALSKEDRAKLAAQYTIATVEGRALSVYNTCSLYTQAMGGTVPTVVAGYRQWQAAGRQVQKGQTGYVIFFPMGSKDKEGNITEAAHFGLANVFDITQTEAKELQVAAAA